MKIFNFSNKKPHFWRLESVLFFVRFRFLSYTQKTRKRSGTEALRMKIFRVFRVFRGLESEPPHVISSGSISSFAVFVSCRAVSSRRSQAKAEARRRRVFAVKHPFPFFVSFVHFVVSKKSWFQIDASDQCQECA
jgi:hypothetical protein